ncbi:MAG: hypothetical protein QJR08_00325 [Bacillota bacterium]|nr:hypothetical protein [Bacillota bacterium]
MAFTVEDFRDLLRILDERPEWKAELRRAVLADDMLELPRIVRELAEAQRRTEVRLDSLAARVEELAEAQKRTEARMEELAEAQRRTEATIRGLVNDVAELKGDSLERRFRENAPAYVGLEYRRARVLSKQELMDALADAEDEGRLDTGEVARVHRAIRDTDAVVRARDAQGEVLLVVEVSQVVDKGDVRRARERAEALRELGARTVPAVAGLRFTEGAESLLAGDESVGRWKLEGVDEEHEPA